MRFSILTLFPEYFDSPLKCSLVGRAIEAGRISVDFASLREFGEGRYRAVDDKPFGGGAGMVMMATVLEAALARLLGGSERLDALEARVREYRRNPASSSASDSGTPVSGLRTPVCDLITFPHVIYLSPQGHRFDAAMAKRWSGLPHVALLCGHYEGIDERFIDAFVHEEVSIGDYVLTGGEPAAAVVLDAVARFLPGVVGEPASVAGDTFESGPYMAPGGLKYPVYTRPALWRGRAVPEILLSGNHGEIARWRLAQSQERTRARRPDIKLKGSLENN